MFFEEYGSRSSSTVEVLVDGEKNSLRKLCFDVRQIFSAGADAVFYTNSVLGMFFVTFFRPKIKDAFLTPKPLVKKP